MYQNVHLESKKNMLELSYAALGVLIGIIGAYAIAKRQLFSIKNLLQTEDLLALSEEIALNLLEKVETDQEFQKRIYVLGVLLGNGIKQGIGLQKSTGKFKLQDVIGAAVMQFVGGGDLGKFFGGGAGQPQGSNTELTP